MNGTTYIVCPNCGFNIVVPTIDSNNDDLLTKDENQVISINNPNFLKYEEEETEG